MRTTRTNGSSTLFSKWNARCPWFITRHRNKHRLWATRGSLLREHLTNGIHEHQPRHHAAHHPPARWTGVDAQPLADTRREATRAFTHHRHAIHDVDESRFLQRQPDAGKPLG